MLGKKIIIIGLLCVLVLLNACGYDDSHVDCLDNTANIYCKEHNFISGQVSFGGEKGVLSRIVFKPNIKCELVDACDSERRYDCKNEITDFKFLEEELKECSVKN